MADKEERIEQFITIQQRTITTRDYETNDEIISEIYPRQQAIEVMAKAIYDEEIGSCNEVMCAGKECKDCFSWKKCEKVAEVALNALLEGGKNVYKTYNNVCSEK